MKKRLLIFVGLGLLVVGLAASAIGGSSGGAAATSSQNQQPATPRSTKSSSQSSFDYQQTAIDVCQTDLSPTVETDKYTTFDPDPSVTRDGLAFTVSGGATVGPNRTTYSCVVVLQGDRLVLSRSAFGE